jgi:hypothetical protein
MNPSWLDDVAASQGDQRVTILLDPSAARPEPGERDDALMTFQNFPAPGMDSRGQ